MFTIINFNHEYDYIMKMAQDVWEQQQETDPKEEELFKEQMELQRRLQTNHQEQQKEEEEEPVTNIVNCIIESNLYMNSKLFTEYLCQYSSHLHYNLQQQQQLQQFQKQSNIILGDNRINIKQIQVECVDEKEQYPSHQTVHFFYYPEQESSSSSTSTNYSNGITHNLGVPKRVLTMGHVYLYVYDIHSMTNPLQLHKLEQYLKFVKSIFMTESFNRFVVIGLDTQFVLQKDTTKQTVSVANELIEKLDQQQEFIHIRIDRESNHEQKIQQVLQQICFCKEDFKQVQLKLDALHRAWEQERDEAIVKDIGDSPYVGRIFGECCF